MSAFGIDIDKRCVCILADGASKTTALDRLIHAVAQTSLVTDVEALRRAVYAREDVMSTGIGGGVGIPHVRIPEVKQTVLGVGISRAGIEFGAADNRPVHLIVLFAMPADSNRLYLGLLAQFMVAVKTPSFRDRLIACPSADEVVGLLNETGG
jgi:mannitol/fructose-specific phosphotransferase system IIA component (Ntr-type)